MGVVDAGSHLCVPRQGLLVGDDRYQDHENNYVAVGRGGVQLYLFRSVPRPHRGANYRVVWVLPLFRGVRVVIEDGVGCVWRLVGRFTVLANGACSYLRLLQVFLGFFRREDRLCNFKADPRGRRGLLRTVECLLFLMGSTGIGGCFPVVV